MSEVNENLNSAPDLSGVLSTLLSSPETLSKLSGILSKFTAEANGDSSPLDSGLSNNVGADDTPEDENQAVVNSSLPTKAASATPDSSVDFSKIASLFSSINLPQKSKNSKEIALLLAIKPYLSPRRKELIDGFIKLSSFSEIFKNFSPKGESDVLQ